MLKPGWRKVGFRTRTTVTIFRRGATSANACVSKKATRTEPFVASNDFALVHRLYAAIKKRHSR